MGECTPSCEHTHTSEIWERREMDGGYVVWCAVVRPLHARTAGCRYQCDGCGVGQWTRRSRTRRRSKTYRSIVSLSFDSIAGASGESTVLLYEPFISLIVASRVAPRLCMVYDVHHAGPSRSMETARYGVRCVGSHTRTRWLISGTEDIEAVMILWFTRSNLCSTMHM